MTSTFEMKKDAPGKEATNLIGGRIIVFCAYSILLKGSVQKIVVEVTDYKVVRLFRNRNPTLYLFLCQKTGYRHKRSDNLFADNPSGCVKELTKPDGSCFRLTFGPKHELVGGAEPQKIYEFERYDDNCEVSFASITCTIN